MSKESLFQYVRREDVVIWIGAGLSLGAGYPSGSELSSIIFDSLTKEEQLSVNKNLALQDISEEFYRLKGNNKNQLIRILKEVFSPKSVKSEVHNQLVAIPHIKTIITTNFDALIENSYEEKSTVLLSSKDITYLQKGKTEVFKVHGDISKPQRIFF